MGFSEDLEGRGGMGFSEDLDGRGGKVRKNVKETFLGCLTN